MKLLRQLAIILALYFLGDLLQNLIHLPIPGNVLGMIILLVCLLSGVIKVEAIEEVGMFLLDHMAFFFVPAAVGLITSLALLSGKWIAVLTVSLISTIVVLAVTGFTVQFLKGGK